MSELVSFAERELAIIEAICEPDELEYQKMINESALELVKVFAEQGHSGFSANTCIQIVTRLMAYQPLSPLTGYDSEWMQIDEELVDGDKSIPMYQNKRCSHVFKRGDHAYDINGKIFVGPDGTAYTSGGSRVPVTFPYSPKREYVKVDQHGIPLK